MRQKTYSRNGRHLPTHKRLFTVDCMKKRSVTLRGHATSITLEDEFWIVLKDIAHRRGQSLAALIDSVDEARIKAKSGGLSSALRVFALQSVLRNDFKTSETIRE